MGRSPRILVLLAVFAMIAGVTSGVATAGGSFVDEDGSMFEPAIEWMAAEGITKGCNPSEGSTRFCPDSYVTHGQMAAFLFRAFDCESPRSCRRD